MLQFIRERAQGVIAWIIVILIIIPFALWGVHQYVGGGEEPAAASVNGTEISQARLQQAYRMQRDRLQQMFGANFRPELFPEETMKAQVLDSLIERELLLQAAASSGMRIADEQLSSTIASIEAFRKEGVFSDQVYRDLLQRQGLSPAYFEQQVRMDMLTAQLERGIASSEFVTAAEQAQQLRLRNQSRDFGYLLLSLDKRSDAIAIDEAELQAYYDSHSDEFMAPEKVAVEYLELSLAALASTVEVSDEEVRMQYESSLQSYRSAEQRHARHILIREDEAILDEVQAKLAEGGDFAALAKEYSEDPGSAARGGDLGFFGRGIMDPAFEEAAFALEVGEVSGPIKSAFGWHLIKVEGVEGGEQQPFDEVADTIRSEIQQRIAEERYFEMAEQLANLSYEHPDSLLPAADALGLEIQRSALFSRGAGEGVAADARVRNAAFAETVKVEGLNSEALELGDGRMLVLRVAESQPEQLRPLAELRDAIEARLKRQKADAQLDALSAELKRALDEGASAEELARANGVEWQRVDAARRDTQGLPRALTAAAFRLPHPLEGKSHSDSLVMPNGDRALLQLYAVHEGDVSIGADEALLNELKGASSQAASDAFARGLRANAEITSKP